MIFKPRRLSKQRSLSESHFRIIVVIVIIVVVVIADTTPKPAVNQMILIDHKCQIT